MSSRESRVLRDQIWHRLTLVTLGLTVLVSVCYLAALISPSLLSGLLPSEKPTQFPYAQSHPRAFAYLSADLDTDANAWHTAAHAF